MGFRGESKTMKIRSKGIIAREIFEQTALSTVYAMNEGAFYRKDTTCFRRLVSPAEYIANTTHIMASLSKGANATSEIGNTGTAPNHRPASNNSRNDENSISLSNIYDISGYSQIRGYLQPLTLTEYLTAIKAPQSASRTYISCSPSSPYYTDSIKILLDADKKPINEISTYGDKIVPMITWYYYNSNGARVSNRQILCIAKWYTSNKYDVTKYKRQQIPFGGGYQDTYYGNHIISSDTIYYSVTVPYVTSSTGDTYKNNVSQGTSLNGFLYSQWGADDTVTAHIKYNDNPLYTMLCAGWDLNSVFKGTTVPVSDAGFGAQITSQDGVGATGAQFVPVFDSVDNIIRLFDDFGVIVTTDWDEVLTPTPTPEESATPNPDPTDREIPNFPDNTTDYTPIEPAYITPSTFGQSCVYNPTTTRDFLNWVCDNTVDIGNWARLFANPADVITGINLYNLDIVAHDAAHVEAKTETNILGVTTPIPNYAILGGYNNIVDGGTLHLQAYYGNYADFTAMTYQMYVPFVGFTTLRACDVVNKTLHLYYAVDFALGSAVAFVNSDDKLIYTSPCTVAGKIPLSTSDRNSQMINNTLSVLGGLSGLLGGVASGNVGGGVGALMGGLGGLQMQTNYSNKGSLSSVNIYKLIPAFVERTRYDLFFPSNDSAYINAKYQTAAGAPSTQFDTLLNCVDAGGFVQSDVVYLTSQTATEAEKQQIIDLIKSGIYL